MFRDEADMLPFENKRYWVYKTHSKKRYPIVFAGDSRTFRGISPKDFELEFPELRGVNLAYSSNGYHIEYLNFLEERLDMDSDDKVIALGITAHSFSKSGSGSNHFRYEKNVRKKEEIIQYMYFYNFSRIFAPYDLKEKFSSTDQNNSPQNFIKGYHFDGWMESYWEHPDTNYAISSYKVIFTDNQYNETTAGTFFRKVEEWTDKDIKVIAYHLPTSHGIMVLEDSLSGFVEDSFIRQFQSAGGIWIEVDRTKYQTFDGSHLDHLSAKQFSRDLANEIRRILNPSE